MQQAGQRSHAVQLFMAHDAQVINVALHLAELGAERVDLVAIAKGDHPALQRIFQHDPHPAGNDREIVKATDLIVGVFRKHGLRVEERDGRDHLADELTPQFAGGLA